MVMRAVLLTIVLLLSACGAPSSEPVTGSVELPSATTDASAFSRALAVRDMRWPDDHGAHDDYLLEWWYYTGNVTDINGRPFGYQLTVFRRALAPPDPTQATPDAQTGMSFSQLYFAHFAISDVQARQHYAFERFSRGAGGLAGAQARPFRAWVQSWTIDEGQGARPIDAAGRVRLKAAEGGVAIDLELTPDKPLVLQADRGLSPKSAEPGNASYYYSFTRLRTQGRITIGSEQFDVSGASWMDHEWSTSLLGDNAEGWDWLALQLDDRRELLIAQVRGKSRLPQDSFMALATLIAEDGTPRTLTRDEVTFEGIERWTSPQTGAQYPTRWRVTIPSANLSLDVRTRFDDQEANLTTLYYEGAVEAVGTADGKPVKGVGYLEMTGYAQSIGAQIR